MPVETTFVELEFEEGGAIELAPDPDEPGGFTLLAQEPDASEDDGELTNAAELFLTREELEAVGLACLRIARKGAGGAIAAEAPVLPALVLLAVAQASQDGKELEAVTIALGPDREHVYGFTFTPAKLEELAGQLAQVMVRWDLQPAGPFAIVPQAGAK